MSDDGRTMRAVPNDADDLLTPSQAAALLGCSARTVTRWADAGRLPVAVTVPGPTGARLFRRSDVLALVGAAA